MAKPVITRTREQAYTVWLDRLESGKEQQAFDALKVNGGFCCLGVLADCAARDGGTQWDDFFFMGDDKLLTLPVLSFMGMTSVQQVKLAYMNDDGKSFKQIASYIRTDIMPKALQRPATYRAR